MLTVMGVDRDRVSRLLKRLQPRQEKVVRLYFGLGCRRPHSAIEIAREFHVSAQVIAGVLSGAARQLARAGLTREELWEAAHWTPRALPSTDRCRHRLQHV